MKRQLRSPRLDEFVALQPCGWPACGAVCCYGGAWLDLLEVEDIRANAGLISRHMSSGHVDFEDWFQSETEADPHALSGRVVHTAIVESPAHYHGTACVFLRPDFRCALQITGEESGLHPWRFKPFYCILHPLDLDSQGRITLDEADVLGEEPGSCLSSANKERQISDIFFAELDYLVGKDA
ncbi:MAG: hypothetical protein EPO32_03470 [Anaerolineae bacterium]|nr:MAG: hypothetical protein EPO32_03470 [Anaerolineae bacterium]